MRRSRLMASDGPSRRRRQRFLTASTARKRFGHPGKTGGKRLAAAGQRSLRDHLRLNYSAQHPHGRRKSSRSAAKNRGDIVRLGSGHNACESFRGTHGPCDRNRGANHAACVARGLEPQQRHACRGQRADALFHCCRFWLAVVGACSIAVSLGLHIAALGARCPRGLGYRWQNRPGHSGWFLCRRYRGGAIPDETIYPLRPVLQATLGGLPPLAAISAGGAAYYDDDSWRMYV